MSSVRRRLARSAGRLRLRRAGVLELLALRVEVGDRGLELVDHGLAVGVGLADERGPAPELERVAAHHVGHVAEGLGVALVELHRPGVGDLPELVDARLELGQRLGERLDLEVEVGGLALRGEPLVRGGVDRGARAGDRLGRGLRGYLARRAASASATTHASALTRVKVVVRDSLMTMRCLATRCSATPALRPTRPLGGRGMRGDASEVTPPGRLWISRSVVLLGRDARTSCSGALRTPSKFLVRAARIVRYEPVLEWRSVAPPSTGRVTPVRWRASSPSRNTATSPMSSACA